MNASSSILAAVNAVYLASFAFFLWNFLAPRDWIKRLANQTLGLGFLVASGFLVTEARRSGLYIPVARLYQALFFFSWSMVCVYLVLAWRLKLDTFGLVLVPLVWIMSLTSFFAYEDKPVALPYEENVLFGVHVVAAFFAYASFALAFVGAILYLIQNRGLKAKRLGPFYHRLPSLEVLETVVYQSIILGFALLTLALASGFIWTRDVFGVFWHWDPKFMSSLLTWFFYLAILYLHYVKSLRGRNVVMVSVLAFFCVLLTFLGVNVFEGGVHSFLK